MNATTMPQVAAAPSTVAVRHVVKGEIVHRAELEFGPPHARFTTPKLDLDALVWRRDEVPPLAKTPVGEIIDILVAAGDYLSRDPEGEVTKTAALSAATSPHPRDLVERSYAQLGLMFNRASMEFMLEQELGGKDVVDGWRQVARPSGRPARIRAFPPRLIHIIAGNSPGVAAQTVIRGALVMA